MATQFEVKGDFVEYQSGGYNSFRNPQIEIVVSKETKIELNFRPQVPKKTGLYVILLKSAKNHGRTKMEKPDVVVGKSKYYIAWHINCHATVLPGRYIAVCTTQAKNLRNWFKVTVKKNEGIDSVKVLPDYERHIFKGDFRKYHGGYSNLADNPQLLLHTRGSGELTIFCYVEDKQKTNALYLILTKPPIKQGRRKNVFHKNDYLAKSKYQKWTWVGFTTTIDPSKGPYLIVPASFSGCKYSITIETEQHGVIDRIEELFEDESLKSKTTNAKEILDPLRTSEKWRYYDENPVPKVEEYCAKNGLKFEDSVFPHSNNDSINKDDGRHKPVLKSVSSWKRPEDFLDDPQVFVDGAEVEDLVQGSVGNCWLCQSMASLSLRQDLISDLIYPKTFSPYGIYSIRLFIEGKFRYVIVDDFIPLKGGSPAFAHSKQRNELYICLIEKAIAKIYSSYRSLCARYLSTALTLLTGGESSNIYHSKITPDNLFNQMLEFTKNNWLMGSTSERGSNMGIVGFHAYTVMKAIEPDCEPGLKLVKLRNTWGRKEWTGKYSDSDIGSWTEELETELEFEDKNDGIFHMEINDYHKHFCATTFCRLVSDYLPFTKQISGDWTEEFGGNWNRRAQNPKYPIIIHEDDTLINVTLKRYAVPDDGHNNALQCYLIRGDLYEPNFRGDQQVAKSGYIYGNVVRFEYKFPKKGKFHIIPCCKKENLDTFDIKVMSSKNIDFGEDFQFEDPLPFQLEEEGKWNPCFGYHHKNNPIFHVFVDEEDDDDEKTKIMIDLTRSGKKVQMGMFMAIMKKGWNYVNGIKNKDVITKTKYLVVSNLSLEVDLEKSSNVPYSIYICTQRKFAGLKYSLRVRAKKGIRLSRFK